MRLNPAQVVRYDWFAGADLLLPALAPGASVIAAAPEDCAEEVLARVPAASRVFVFHLNCSVTASFPADRRALVESLEARGLAVLNGGAVDIRKRCVQSACARLGLATTSAARDGDPEELVIVKTDLNYGGASEWGLSDPERERLGVGAGSDIMWKPEDYRVVPRAEVEERWWTDPRLVCERYVGEIEGLWYRWFRLGSRAVLCELASEQAVKKVGNSRLLRSWLLDAEAPDDPAARSVVLAARSVAEDLGLDFGAVDVLTDGEGRAFVIDVNTTPAYLHPVPGLVSHLAPALAALASP